MEKSCNSSIEEQLLILKTVYREALGIEPSETFITTQKNYLKTGKDLHQLIESIFRSQALKNHRIRKVQQESVAIYYMPNLIVSPNILEELFNTTAYYWRNQASKESEIYYSVVSSETNRKVLSANERRAFFQTGNNFVDFCLTVLEKHLEKPLKDIIALDFGCGVGRLSINAAHHFLKLFSVDFSRAHLAELSKNIQDFFPQHKDIVFPVEVQSLADIENLPYVDFMFSLIVLQHNTPPVMAYLVKNLLSKLLKGGVAALQVPLYIPYYEFDCRKYLTNSNSGKRMEMHILPKQNMQEIARQVGCEIVDSYGMGTKNPYSELIVFKRV